MTVDAVTGDLAAALWVLAGVGAALGPWLIDHHRLRQQIAVLRRNVTVRDCRIGVGDREIDRLTLQLDSLAQQLDDAIDEVDQLTRGQGGAPTDPRPRWPADFADHHWN